MIIFFVASFIKLTIDEFHFASLSRLASIGSSFSVAALVAYSRVYLGAHTFSQVLVGSLCGMAFSVVWFRFMKFYLIPFKRLNHLIFSFFLLIENIFFKKN